MSKNYNTNLKKAWGKKSLENLLKGRWLVEPAEDWCCWDIAINESGCAGEGTLFIAIDEERWHQESSNTGMYVEWADTHVILPKFQHEIVGAVVERHIEELEPSIPQLLVENSYEAISILGAYARENYIGKIIAITGTFCKSATKIILHHLLEAKGEVESTHKNHSFSIGVPMTLAKGIKQPNYIVLEIAISALEARSAKVFGLVRPHISIITEIDLGMSESNAKEIKDTARIRALIAQGIEPGGIAILNRDMKEYDLVKSEVKSYGAVPMSYGSHEDADFRLIERQSKENGSWVTVKTQNQEFQYYLPSLETRIIMSSLAALCAIYVLGINPGKILDRFSSIQFNNSSKPKVLDGAIENYGVQAIDAESEEVLLAEGNPFFEVNQGIGGILLLSLLIERIILGEIKLNDYVTIGTEPIKESGSTGAIGLQEGERVSVHVLLNAVICQNAPDAMIALAEKIAGNTGEALMIMKNLSTMLELSNNSVENITGRFLLSKKQSFSLSDLTKSALLLFSFPMTYLKMLSITTLEYNGKLFSLSSNLMASGKVFCGYLFGENSGEGIILSLIKGRKVILSVCGARDNFHRDYILTKAIDKLTFSSEEVNRISVKEKLNITKDCDIRINILGDTYFGVEDYCFKGIEALLRAGDLNTVNLEAVLIDDSASSPLQGIKPDIHGSKTEESILIMRNYNIHAVTLGNDHAMDFGADGINSMVKALEANGIQYIGAGYNCNDASEPMRIQIGNYEIIIFNGYWHEELHHHIYESYALGVKPGVACLSGEIMERIREEKRKSTDSFIITIAHWGSDSRNVLPSQRAYAKQLVESGTDLIIGHGTHMMQEIQQLNGKWVLYGIGNGVYGSNGVYDERRVTPYSFFVQLRIEKTKVKSILLYPILSDNLKNFWQTHTVTQDQFKEVISYQKKIGTPMEKFGVRDDEFGNFIEIPLAL